MTVRVRELRTSNWRAWIGPLVLFGAAAEIAGAALTQPFTWSADVVVAIALVALLVTVLVQRQVRQVPRILARRAAPALGEEKRSGLGQRWWLWIGLFCSVIAWELFNYASSPRAAHPTISSLLDSFDGHVAGRAFSFASWMVLGWYLVTR